MILITYSSLVTLPNPKLSLRPSNSFILSFPSTDIFVGHHLVWGLYFSPVPGFLGRVVVFFLLPRDRTHAWGCKNRLYNSVSCQSCRGGLQMQETTPFLLSHLPYTCLLLPSVHGLVILISDRSSSLDASSVNPSFLSTGGHALLSTEDSRSPRLTDVNGHTARWCWRASDEIPPQRVNLPWGEAWPRPPPPQHQGLDLSQGLRAQHLPLELNPFKRLKIRTGRSRSGLPHTRTHQANFSPAKTLRSLSKVSQIPGI